MASSHRRHRFSRRHLRADLFGLRLRILWVVAGGGVVLWLTGLWVSPWAWAVFAALFALALYYGLRDERLEVARWEDRRQLEVRVRDGALHVSRIGGGEQVESLGDVVSIEAILDGERVTRVLVDRPDGSRSVYAAFEDMDAFAADLRLAVPQARYRRMRPSFWISMKEAP